jgi:hypothetical protein
VEKDRMRLPGAPGDTSQNDGPSIVSGRYDRWTAVYDISAHTVYMPDGTRLEAHSGLGTRLDDPRHVDEKRRGATPPNLYDLEPREELFHGVRALRLIPVDNEKVFRRAVSPDGQTLTVRRYLGFELLGRNDIWYRLPDSAFKQLDPIVVAKYLPAQPPAVGSVSLMRHPQNSAKSANPVNPIR